MCISAATMHVFTLPMVNTLPVVNTPWQLAGLTACMLPFASSNSLLQKNITADQENVWIDAIQVNRYTSFHYHVCPMLNLMSLGHFHRPFHTVHDSCAMCAKSKRAFLYNLHSSQQALSMLCATTQVADWFPLQTNALPGPGQWYNCTPGRHLQVTICLKPAWYPTVICTSGKTFLQ